MKKNKKALKKLGTVTLSFTLLFSGVPSSQLAQAATTASIPNHVTIGKGETFQLTTKESSSKLSFRSYNKKIVSVTKSGKIKGKKVGSTTVIAKINKKTKKCKITVKAAPKKISFTKKEITLLPNTTKKLSVNFSSGYSNKITYKSENTTVASVSANGSVTAKKAGETTITAKTFNGKTATIRCIVANNNTPAPTNTAVSTAIPSTTDSVLPTNDVATSTPTISATTASSLEPTHVEATTTPTGSENPEKTNTPSTPTFSPDASKIPSTQDPTTTPTLAPTDTVTTAPTDTVTTAPTDTVTTAPSATVSVSVAPTVTPTAAAEPTVTSSAIISKIENGTIYIDDNKVDLQLTSKVTYYKDCYNGSRYQITKNELLPGDTIEITSSGLVTDTYPVSTLVGCEQIVVTKSVANAMIEDKISNIVNKHTIEITNHPNTKFYIDANTTVYKNNQVISFNELKADDVIRVCAYNPNIKSFAKIPSMNSYTGFARTIVVLGDSVADLNKAEALVYSVDKTSSLDEEVLHTDQGDFYVSDETLLEITNTDGSITYKSAIGQTADMKNITIYYETLYPKEHNEEPMKRAIRICYTK